MLINNRYEIIEGIGRGGFGDVLKAKDKKNDDMIVAIKQIIKSKMDFESFNNEINCLKFLECEYSVKIYEYITDDPIYYYIIMEYCDTDLQTILNNTLDINDGLNGNQIRKILFQLNYIFKKMYSIKIIHRDLKPNNIFIKYTNDEQTEFDIKLGDYGFTKEVSSAKKTRTNVGSFYFIAPEVIKEKYNNKSDLWSLGVIIYYLVTKRLPFNSYEEIIEGKYKKEDFPSNWKLLKNIVEKLLVVDIDKRLSWNEYLNNELFKKMEKMDFKKEEYEEIRKKFSKYKDNIIVEKTEFETKDKKYYGEIIKNSNNILHGIGILLMKQEGVIYKGLFNKNKKEGKGIYIDVEDNKYEGDWKNNNIEGTGIFYFSDGTKYEGEWKNNKKNGKGTFYFSNNEKFVGEWKNDQREGKGIYYYLNGDKYEIEYKNDNTFTNKIKYFYSNNGSIYEGDYINNKIEGKGICYYKDNEKYDGEWKNGKKDGKGIYYYSDGGKYDGNWKNNNREGRGIAYYSNGERYDGDWKNDKKEGKGIYYFNNGSYYSGEWKNGKREGKGIYIDSKGEKYEGEWENDDLNTCIIF